MKWMAKLGILIDKTLNNDYVYVVIDKFVLVNRYRISLKKVPLLDILIYKVLDANLNVRLDEILL